MKIVEKKKAIELRRSGRSIKDIARLLRVSKGSVSVWVRSVELSDNVRTDLKNKGFTNEAIEKRRKSRLENELKKRAFISENAEKEIGSLSKENLKILGLALYWAEGGKTERGLVRVANSDPVIIKTMIRFFVEICGASQDALRAHVHTHSHLNARVAEEYWSGISGIPREHFYKTYSKPSKASKNKKDTLPYGTLDLIICDTKLFLRISGWISKVKKLVG